MSSWKRVSLLLCTFGFVRELRPSEPYVSEFLLGPWRNITEQQLNKQVYPISTYSYLALLVIVFLVTDYLRYKPLIVLSGLCGVLIYAILLWTESLVWLQVSQLLFGLYMATEVAYYTYMFAKVDKDQYDRVASWTRAAALVGRFVSGLSAQLFYSYNVMNLRQLNYITFTSQIASVFWVVLLPKVSRSVYFHREVEIPLREDNEQHRKTTDAKQLYGISLLWEHARSAYSRPAVLAWSLWYAASSAGYLQVQAYMQLLWKEIAPQQQDLWNGMVEAVLTVLGALSALAAGRALTGRSDVSRRRLLVLVPVLTAAVQAAAALVAANAQQLWVCYVGYTVLGALFHFTVTVASVEIARKLVYDSCFGLIFGINTLLALILQSLLTLVFISDLGLGLPIRGQYQAYAGCYVMFGISAAVVWAVGVVKKRKKQCQDES